MLAVSSDGRTSYSWLIRGLPPPFSRLPLSSFCYSLISLPLSFPSSFSCLLSLHPSLLFFYMVKSRLFASSKQPFRQAQRRTMKVSFKASRRSDFSREKDMVWSALGEGLLQVPQEMSFSFDPQIYD